MFTLALYLMVAFVSLDWGFVLSSSDWESRDRGMLMCGLFLSLILDAALAVVIIYRPKH